MAPTDGEYLFPQPPGEADLRESPFGHVVYPDGAQFPFFHLDQYVNYTGTFEMLGAMWGAGRSYHDIGCWTFDERGERARVAHEQEHGGEAVFVLNDDYHANISFGEAWTIAAEQRAWTYAEARLAAGMTVVTARRSTGGKAPRKPLT